MNNPYDDQGSIEVSFTRLFLEQTLAGNTTDLYECCENGIHHSISERGNKEKSNDDIILVIRKTVRSKFATGAA